MFIAIWQQETACKTQTETQSLLALLCCLFSCRIDRNGEIKVADFGLTEDMYGTNYFRRRKSVTGSEEKVPLRWMAAESIEKDIYTEATDVVSYYYSGTLNNGHLGTREFCPL